MFVIIPTEKRFHINLDSLSYSITHLKTNVCVLSCKQYFIETFQINGEHFIADIPTNIAVLYKMLNDSLISYADLLLELKRFESFLLEQLYNFNLQNACDVILLQRSNVEDASKIIFTNILNDRSLLVRITT